MRNVTIGLGLLVSFIVGCGAASKSPEPATPATGAAGYAPAEESVSASAPPASMAAAPGGAAMAGAPSPEGVAASAPPASRSAAPGRAAMPAAPSPSPQRAAPPPASVASDKDSSAKAGRGPAKPSSRIVKERPAPALPQAGQLTAGVW